MTSIPALLVLACAVLLLAGAALWLQPKVLHLDAERLFKAALASRASANGLNASALAPYHPLGRLPERKVDHPDAETPDGGWLPGEKALVEELAQLKSPKERWAALFRNGAPSVDELEPAYAPATWLGPRFARPGVWNDDAVATEAEARCKARWVVVVGELAEGAPALGDAWAAWAAVHRVGAGSLAEQVDEVRAALEAACPGANDEHLILVGEGSGAVVLLRALADCVQVRDHLAAVLLVGGPLGGWAHGELTPALCRDWNDAWVRHALLDTERVKLTPWMSVGWFHEDVSPAGLPGLPLGAQRMPPVAYEHQEPEAVERLDLGALAVTALATPLDQAVLVHTLRNVVAATAYLRS